MKTLFTALWLGLLAWCPAALAAGGDISVRITDVYDRAIAGTNGAKATLVGLDQRGVFSLGPKDADANGVVHFPAQQLSAMTQGPWSFVIYTSGSNPDLQGKLYDPFGSQWTYIQYRAEATYDFTVPTPTIGSAQPRLSWNKMNVQIGFQLDWGNRRNRDFWFTRVVLQKSATQQAHAGYDYGLTPLVTDAWLRDHGLAAEDGGLANGQIGSVRLTKPGYDESLLAQKILAGPSVQYQVYLVNCLWEHDLVGIYDPETRTYTVEFDPTTVFADASAPAWDGFAMNKEVGYYATLQAETWLPHSAGANGGLACAFGPPVAQSLLYPLHIDVDAFRAHAIVRTGEDIQFQIYGLPGSFLVEYSTDLKSWKFLSSGSLSTAPGVGVDHKTGDRRFYRVRRAAAPSRVQVVSCSANAGTCTLSLSGTPGPTTIEFTVSLSRPRWTTLVTTNVTQLPFIFVDRDALDDSRFYRVRQP